MKREGDGMNDIFEVLARRRSVRNFRQDPVEQETLEKIIAAGRMAASGGNNHTTHLLVIQNHAFLRTLRELVEQAFADMEITEDMYRSMQNSVRLSKQGGYEFYYQAPMLIVTANRRGYTNALVDSACVLENMMLAATALGVGSCWINQLHWLDDDPAIRGALEAVGLRADETITGGVALGYPAGDNAFFVREKAAEDPVTYVR